MYYKEFDQPYSNKPKEKKKQEAAFVAAIKNRIDNRYGMEHLQAVYNDALIHQKAAKGMSSIVETAFDKAFKEAGMTEQDRRRYLDELYAKQVNLNGFKFEDNSPFMKVRQKQYNKNKREIHDTFEIRRMNTQQLIDRYKAELVSAKNSKEMPNMNILKAINARKNELMESPYIGLSGDNYQKLSFKVENNFSKSARKREKEINDNLEFVDFVTENPGLYPGRGEKSINQREFIIDMNKNKVKEGSKVQKFLHHAEFRLESEKKNNSYKDNER